MCGICGYAGFDEPGLIEKMTAALAHRGPDDVGYFRGPGIHLGHRRLSVIDIAGGHQPMTTPDGALTIVFNGEVYNFQELRQDLIARGLEFRTSTDTEVILRLWESEGVAAVEKFNGMFAFAVHDRRTGELFLVRDRVGIKPLSYLAIDGKLLFASEGQALQQYAGWSRDWRPQAVDDYLSFRYVPSGQGLLSGLQHLPAGHILRYHQGAHKIWRYWEPPASPSPSPPTESAALDQLEELMQRSVARRMISDVPVGAYLSGGLDSSLLVRLMSARSNHPVRTFSIAFQGIADESGQAAETARRLGCHHTPIPCSAADVALLPEVINHCDEPMGDAISIPMYKLAREAKKSVTVILSGEGADEIFAGYLFHKVIWAAEIYRRLAPTWTQTTLAPALCRALPTALLNLAFSFPASLGDRGKLKALDYVRGIPEMPLAAAYAHLISLFDDRDKQRLYTPDFASHVQSQTQYPAGGDDRTFTNLLRLQFDHWLPANMLHRQDRMSMAHAIEARVPFLDHELVEFALSLPRSMALRGLTGKYLLRRLAKKLDLRKVAGRRKAPFYVPVEEYVNQPLFLEMEGDLLGESALRKRGIFRPESVRQIQQLARRREFLPAKQIFSLMSLELWFRRYVDQQ